MTDGRRTDDGRTTEHGYTISSPCEPDGSGELKIDEWNTKVSNVDSVIENVATCSWKIGHY